MIKIAICDDEEIDAENVKGKLNEILTAQNILSETQTFLHARDLLVCDDLQTFDLIFLDIDMPEVDGISLAKDIRDKKHKCKIIFITNHEEMVYETFKYEPFRFIRKYKIDEELEEAVVSILKNHFNSSEKIIFETKSGKIKISVDDILYFEVQGHSVICVTLKNKYTLKEPLFKIKKQLNEETFLLVHKSYLVNSLHMFSVEQTDIVLKNIDIRIPLSKHRRKDIKKQFISIMEDL